MRNISKNNIKLLLILIIVLAFIPYKLIFSKAEENTNNNENEIALDSNIVVETTTQSVEENNFESDQEEMYEDFISPDENQNVEELENLEDTISKPTVDNTVVENIVSEIKDNVLENKVPEILENKIENTNSLVKENKDENTIQTDLIDKETITKIPEKSLTSSNLNALESVLNSVEESLSPATNSEFDLQATLWDSEQYSNGTGTQLTDSGVTINNWEFETTKYLQIDPVVPADGNTYVVSIELPQEFYVQGSELPVPSGYQSVNFTKNENIVINSSTTYSVNKYSGTAEFTLNNMGVSGSIQLGIGYDVVLWDKQANSSLTPDGVCPIIIKLSRKEASGELVEVKRVFVSKAFSGSKNSDTMHMNVNREGESASQGSSIIANKDKRIRVIKSISDNSGHARYKYALSATITIKLPSYKDTNGNIYYLDFDESKLSLSSVKYASKSVDMSQIGNGIVTINVEKLYWKTGNFISIMLGPLPEELEALEENSFVFKSGSIKTVYEGKNGNSNIVFGSLTIPSIEYQKETLENVTISSTSKQVTITKRPDGVVSMLGGFYLENKGTGDSTSKNIDITFDTGNTNLIKVTTINTFADTVQDYIDIKYTLVDEAGQRVYLNANGNRVNEGSDGAIGEWIYSVKNAHKGSSTKDDLKNTITRSKLPESHRQYYFKSVNYTIQSIKVGVRLYKPSASSTLTGAGNFLGYVDDVNGKNNSKATSKIVVTSVDNSSIANLTKTITTTLQTTSTATFGIESAAINKSTIQAGESLNISGKISAASYPYGNTTWIKGIILAVKLPKEITINEQAISLKDSKGQVISGHTISTQEVENNNILWKIKLPEDICIGGVNESIGALPLGRTISFDIQLDTSYTMNAATIFVRDLVTVAAYKQRNYASGAWTWALKTDTYDLNGDGSVTDSVGGIKTSTTSNCQILSQTATLDVQDSITIESNGNISNESSSGVLISAEDIINYNLDIGCFSGGRAEGFCYYIPIPKKTMLTDGFLIDNGKNGKFELELYEEPTVTGSDILNIGYIMQEGITYNSAQEIENWYTVDQINNDSSLKFEDVTMIKLSVKEEGIKNGDKTRVTLKLKYAGDAFLEESGMENIWHSGGFYKHINSDRENAGNYATGGVSVTLSSVDIECPDITLTAARNMEPTGQGNVNTSTIEETEFPIFENGHTFKIVDVETYNVTLQTKSYMLLNTDMPGIEANKNFAITIQMSNGEINVLESAKEKPIVVGSIAEKSSPSFTYKLYNADALNENSQTRYVIITLESENGLRIKQRININREVVQASDPQIAIVEGKRYLNFDDISTEAVISQDSAFTAQFILEYIPETYKDERITFSTTLPVGTKVVLENLTDDLNPTYWYYTVNTPVSSINLEQFVLMGKTGNENYNMPTNMDIINEKMLVIVDFSQCMSHLSPNTYTVKLQLTGKSNDVEDFSSNELKFSIKNKNTFTLNEIANAKMGDNFKINYSMNLTQGADAKYQGRKASLVITAPDNIPSDTMLTVQNNVYNLNSEKQFIISLGDIKTQTSSLELNIFSNMQPNNETTYEFDVALWISATANADAPKLGELIINRKVNITTNNELNPSLKVIKMSSRIVKKDKLNEAYTINYKYIPDDNCNVTVELQQKIGTAYKKVTDKLSQVNGSTIHTMGEFTVNAVDGNNTLEFKLSSITEKATYRIVFKVTDGNGTKLLEVPYNFILLDK